MKNTTITTLAALLLGSAVVNADPAYTKPAGFVTHTLKAGQFNLIGLTLHQPVTATGDFTAVSGTTLTDGAVNFGTALTAGKTYILEITEASNTTLNGAIQEVTVWSGNTITTGDDLSSQGLVVGDKYQIRAATTIADVFGATNTLGLEEGDSTSADVVWVSTGGGAFKKYYYSDGTGFGLTTGWREVSSGNNDQSLAPMPYMDAIFIQRRGTTDLDLVITGSIKTEATTIALNDTFNFISNTYPVGSTLDNSGLASVVLPGDSTSADVIWVPNGLGGYLKYYFSDGSGFGVTAGWRRVDTGNNDAKDEALKSGIIIQRRAASPYNATIVPPSTWDLDS